MTTHTKFLTASIGAAIATMAAPALLFLGAGTAQAIQDVNEAFVVPLPAIQDVSDSLPDNTVGAFNPQPDTPGIDDPGIKVRIDDPGIKVGIGGPDTRPVP